jgi:DnaK suppressor protein
MITREEHLRKIDAQLREALEEAERDIEELDEQVRSFGETGELAEGADNHPGDDSDRLSEQERLLTIRGQLAERKAEIEYALTKVDQDTFGVCERCGKPIPEERLEALPFARYCVECQEILDREEAMTP